MKRLVLLMLLGAAPAHASDNPHLNLDFESGSAGGKPRVWYTGGRGYAAALDVDDPHGGALCLRLTRTDSVNAGFGVATGRFPVDDARGRTIRYTGWIRTAGVTDGYAGLWWRVDGPGGTLAFDNMHERGVTGDTGWREFVIELPVGREATNINFGCLHSGGGTAWFDDLAVTLDGEPYAQAVPEPFRATDAEMAWIAAHAHPFATDDPGHGHADLAFVSRIVGDARIVALGEGTHGTAEFFRMKHRLTRYLVEELGFGVFVIEASLPECERINRYVLTGEGDPAQLVADMYFWTWRTEEVLALVEWMRAHNAAGGRIEFRGNDMQYPAWSMKTVQDAVAAHAPDLLLDVATTYAELRGHATAGRSRDRPATLPATLVARVEAIRPALAERTDDLREALGADDVAWLLQSARLVEQYAGMASGHPDRRDLAMADNTDWLLSRYPEGTRFVLWAHNGHVSRAGYGDVASMGTHLANRHGDDYLAVGFLFHAGTYTAFKHGEGLGAWPTSPSRPGSVEWALHRTGEPRLVLDLRAAVAGSAASGWVHRPVDVRSIGAVAVDDAFSLQVVGDHFDAIVFFAASTATTLLDVAPHSSWDVWEEE